MNTILKVICAFIALTPLHSFGDELPFELKADTKLGFTGNVIQTIPKAGLLVIVKEVRYNSRFGLVPLSDGDVPASLRVILLREYPGQDKLIDSSPVVCASAYIGSYTYISKDGSTKKIGAFKFDKK